MNYTINETDVNYNNLSKSDHNKYNNLYDYNYFDGKSIRIRNLNYLIKINN
jgi:hypothetical protein